jgi:hypothetical protein
MIAKYASARCFSSDEKQSAYVFKSNFNHLTGIWRLSWGGSSRQCIPKNFLTATERIVTIFPSKRHRLSARSYHDARADAFDLWNDYVAHLAT